MGTHIKSYDGRTVSAFEGIPYAKPPVGALRFKKPELPNKWTNILIANKTFVCIQYATSGQVTGSEDCLYLNVYVPLKRITGNENFDVVVGLHSGGFMRGDPHSLMGPDYLMDRDLVYVSLSYRLSMLGFLSTEDDGVSGNNGLKDQVLAFQWINNNIKYFGGNPKSVTLVGVSAGASSIQYHYLSPMAKDLFQRGISISGTALVPWALRENPAKYAKQLARIHHCPEEPSKQLVECLRKIDVNTLIASVVHFDALPPTLLPLTPFGPVIENAKDSYLSEHPYKLLLSGKIKNAPWITSNVLNEGLLPVEPIVKNRKLETLDENWNVVLPEIAICSDTVAENNKVPLAIKLREFYLNNETLSINNVYGLVNLMGDRMFVVDGGKAALLQAKMSKSPVYYYYFRYHLQMRASFPDQLEGVGHMDDSRLIFSVKNNPKVLQPTDEKMKNMFINFVSNFASGKKPTIGMADWIPIQQLQNKDMLYLSVDEPENIQMRATKGLAPYTFWNSLPIKENEKLFTK